MNKFYYSLRRETLLERTGPFRRQAQPMLLSWKIIENVDWGPKLV